MQNVGGKTRCIMGDMQMENGLKGVARHWFSSYPSNRPQRVCSKGVCTYSQLC